MSDELGDRLAAAIDAAAAPVPATEAMLRGKRQLRRRATVAACVAVVTVVAAGVAVASAATRHSSGPRVFVGDTTTSTTTRSAPVSAHIELPSSAIIAGQSETGHLVIENNTGNALQLGAECFPDWTVVLGNRALPQQAAFRLSCIAGGRNTSFGPGETKLPFTLLTTYQECSSTGYPEGKLIPECLPDANGGLYIAPPLPPGLYHATFFSRGKLVATNGSFTTSLTVAPVLVRVVTSTSPSSAAATDAAGALSQYLADHPDVVVHSEPVASGDTEIALVGFETDPQHRVIVVVPLAGATTPRVALPLPFPYYDFARDLPVQVADVTGDGLPDFLVRFDAADNQPGVVVSADGGTWHLVPESSDPADVYIGRDATIADGRLQTTRNDCVPTCAQGHTTTVTWRFDRTLRRMVPQ